MRESAPDHVTDQPHLVGEDRLCADARLRCELCAHHVQVRIAAYWCDDAEVECPYREGLYSLAEVIAWCRTLATGEDHTTGQETWGRVDPSTFSLHSHVGNQEQDPARQWVWFYPMTEARLCLGVQVGPTIPALRSCFTWASNHLDVVEPEVRSEIADGINTCLALLGEADRRPGHRGADGVAASS